MAPSRSALAHVTALALATAAIASGGGERLPRTSALAQTPASPQTFPLPDELPANAVLKLDGSPSMTVANESFRQRFTQRFPNAQVELTASRTDEALQRLIKGDLDVVAAGRPLTDEERAQGLTEIPIEREKIALIVGPGNGFTGDLAFEQFAQIFYGDVTNWAAVGGPDVPMRLVDRPDHSDTRQALGQYPVFTSRPFAPGPNTQSVGDDSTDAVIAALGNDGIGYAVVSQVQGREDVRIVAMDGTFPSDPRYPYSQPRYYVYNSKNPSPAALAFLAVATTVPDQGSSPAIAGDSSASPNPTPASNPSPPSPAGATAEPGTPAPTDYLAPGNTGGDAGMAEITAPTGSIPALVPPAPDTTIGRGGLPWWLLGIPILGGLLWWLLRNLGSAPGAVPLGAGNVDKAVSRIILTPRTCRRAYAYWEVPDTHRARGRDRGGRDLMLRLLDVTDRDTERHPPVRIEQFAVTEDQQDLHLPIPVDNRDYQVELGYVTGENHWLPLAKSDPIRVPACPVGETDRSDTGALSLEPSLGMPGLVGSGATAIAAPPNTIPTPTPAVPTDNLAVIGSDTTAVAEVSSLAATEARDSVLQTLTIHRRHHTVRLDGAQMEHLQNQVAAAYSLVPGSYLIKIKDGSFSYGDPAQPGEPLVLLWIYGGQVTNLKTQVPVQATWSTLNGYADTLSLEVDESAQLRAFFIDTFPDNNLGSVTLSIVQR